MLPRAVSAGCRGWYRQAVGGGTCTDIQQKALPTLYTIHMALPTLYSGSYRSATEDTTDTLQRELPTSDRGHYRHDTERRYRQPTWRYRQATEGATIPELRSHNYRVFSRSIGQMEGHACSVHLNVVLLFPQDGPSCNSTICTLHMSNLVSQQMFLKCSSFGRHEINKNPREVLPNEHLLHESW